MELAEGWWVDTIKNSGDYCTEQTESQFTYKSGQKCSVKAIKVRLLCDWLTTDSDHCQKNLQLTRCEWCRLKLWLHKVGVRRNAHQRKAHQDLALVGHLLTSGDVNLSLPSILTYSKWRKQIFNMLTSIHSLPDSLTHSQILLNNTLTFNNMSIYINKCLIKNIKFLLSFMTMCKLLLYEIYFI